MSFVKQNGAELGRVLDTLRQHKMFTDGETPPSDGNSIPFIPSQESLDIRLSELEVTVSALKENQDTLLMTSSYFEEKMTQLQIFLDVTKGNSNMNGTALGQINMELIKMMKLATSK